MLKSNLRHQTDFTTSSEDGMGLFCYQLYTLCTRCFFRRLLIFLLHKSTCESSHQTPSSLPNPPSLSPGTHAADPSSIPWISTLQTFLQLSLILTEQNLQKSIHKTSFRTPHQIHVANPLIAPAHPCSSTLRARAPGNPCSKAL